MPPLLASTPTDSAPINLGWPAFRTLAVLGFVVVMALLAAAKEQRGVSGIDVILASGGVILALVFSLALGRWRNLNSFTRLAFWLSLLMLFGEVGSFSRARASAARSPETPGSTDDFVAQKAPRGNVTLLVPKSWSVRTKDARGGTAILLGSSDGEVLGAVTESVEDFAPQLDLPGYTEILRAVYTTKFEASVGTAEATMIGDMPAQRVLFEGTHSGVKLKGYVYLAKTEHAFCHVFAYTAPTKFDELEATLVAAVERSRID